MSDAETPSQTIGPFFAILLPLPEPAAAAGDVTIEGHVFDGAGENVPDALVEAWSADERGHGAFRRAFTSADGFRLALPRPGAVRDDWAPHVEIAVFARGLLRSLATRAYFDDEAANERDTVLRSVERGRRPTLLARATGRGVYRFDIHLQGDEETVFFER